LDAPPLVAFPPVLDAPPAVAFPPVLGAPPLVAFPPVLEAPPLPESLTPRGQQVGPAKYRVPESPSVELHAEVAAHRRPARAAEARARLGEMAGGAAAAKGSNAGLDMKA
jgi:hypothetical protein